MEDLPQPVGVIRIRYDKSVIAQPQPAVRPPAKIEPQPVENDLRRRHRPNSPNQKLPQETAPVHSLLDYHIQTGLASGNTVIMEKTEFDNSEEKMKSVIGQVMTHACNDEWQFAIRLVTGETIFFSHADYTGNGWFHLYFGSTEPEPCKGMGGINLDRGMDVNMKHIVWAVSTPHGS